MHSFKPLQGVPEQSSTSTLCPPSNEDGSTNLKTPFEPKVEEASRLTRTPSPTPSEAKELESGPMDWKRLLTWKFWFRREWIWHYVVLILILVITTLMVMYHKQIVTWLTPAATWMYGLPAGWLVPIAILFVISFPPLFGHEIVAALCGLVWGLWVGFAIVSAGTLLGEIGNFYAFKFCCRARGEKWEKTKITYASLARVVRDGGFKIAVIARLSAIPAHFTTAIFSTCGMNIFIFILAAFLSLPKQFSTVYLGVILRESNTAGGQSRQSTIINNIIVNSTIIITIGAMLYIRRLMKAAKPQIIYERRKARQAKLQRAEHFPFSNEEFSSTDVFHPNTSDTPLNDQDVHYQKWDRDGKAVGYATDPSIISPKPLAANANATFLPSKYTCDVDEGGNLMSERVRQESTDAVGRRSFFDRFLYGFGPSKLTNKDGLLRQHPGC